MEESKDHWDAVYGARPPEALTWFEAEPALSADLVARHATRDQPVIDVGGGASRLPDALLVAGFTDVTVLDLSSAALAASQARLGDDAARITWLQGDVTRWDPPRTYALWHDRAVFHFLTDAAQQEAYIGVLHRALAPGGHAIMATFAENGPETCSGLPVQRYSSESLAARLDRAMPGVFVPVTAARHTHVTPKGARQAFQVSVFRRS